MVAMNIPIATNDSASPAASAAGPARCSPTAVPRIAGNSGSTHGDSVERSPARKANAMAPAVMLVSAYLRVEPSNVSIDAGLVSPAERPVSVAPL